MKRTIIAATAAFGLGGSAMAQDADSLSSYEVAAMAAQIESLKNRVEINDFCDEQIAFYDALVTSITGQAISSEYRAGKKVDCVLSQFASRMVGEPTTSPSLNKFGAGGLVMSYPHLLALR